MPLIQKQIKNLDILIQHPKFGNFLQDAVNFWTKPNVYPLTNVCGIDWLIDSDTYKPFISYEYKTINSKFNLGSIFCCIMGAAAFGKLKGKSLETDLSTYFKISISEYRNIQAGFALKNFGNEKIFDQETYNFGKRVNLAIWSD